jgi:hypothetical protein
MTDDALAEMIQTHVARYPAAEVADVYKLLHQATFGPGHLITDKRAAREFLEQECGQLTPSPAEALVESIHPAGEIVRVHLRPYLAISQRLNWLLDAFVRSAEQVEGSRALMAQRWLVFESLCAGDETLGERMPMREVRLFGTFRADELWPAVNHSPAYVAAYQPKYRVLTCSEAEALCGRLKVPFEVV